MCELSTLSVDELVGAYIKTRNDKKALEKEQEEALKPYKDALEKLEAEVHKRLNEAGVESMKTKLGTAYKKTLSSVKVIDRSAFMDFVNDGHIDLLDVRPSKTAVEAYLEEHQELPIGLDISRTESVGFRA